MHQPEETKMVKIVEVGPRDGLQNETAHVPLDAKIAFVDALSLSGVSEIEVSAFVSPRWVPQLADAEEVFRKISRKDSVVYSALVPNERGLERAVASRVDKVSVFTAASETFNRKNINTSTEGSIRRFLTGGKGRARRGTRGKGICLDRILVRLRRQDPAGGRHRRGGKARRYRCR